MIGSQLTSYPRFLGYAAIAVAAALFPVLVYALGTTLLMAFGAVLVATLLRLASEPLQRWTPLPVWASLLIGSLVVLGILLGAAWVFGNQLTAEMSDVLGEAQRGAQELRERLSHGEFGGLFMNSLQQGISVTAVLERAMSISISALEALVVIVISSAYLAATPDLYAEGVVKLVPQRHREWARESLYDIARALRYWMLGQLMEMLAVGALTTLACYFIPLPSPFALGLIAGVAEFVPYVGPIFSAIPALLIALTKDTHTVIWTLVAYLAIHQVEGNLLAPLIQRKMTYVPPALLLIGIAAFSSLAGIFGLIFAAPMVVCAYVLVQKVYLRDVLKEPTKLAGEPGEEARAEGNEAAPAREG